MVLSVIVPVSRKPFKSASHWLAHSDNLWGFLKKFCSDWNSCNSKKQWDTETHMQLHGLVKFSLDHEHFSFISDSTQRTAREIGRNNPVKRGRTKWTFTKLHTAQNWRRWMFCKVGNWFLDFTNICTIYIIVFLALQGMLF